MAVWVSRAGKLGVDEEFALETNCVVLAYADRLNLIQCNSKDALRTVLMELEPNAPQMRIAMVLGQLWRFRTDMQIGELVLMPRHRRSDIAIGIIDGLYEYHGSSPEGRRHRRKVKWIDRSVLRSRFDPEVLRRIAFPLFNFELPKNDVKTPEELLLPSQEVRKDIEVAEAGGFFETDVEETARDIIRKRIELLFPLHGLELLVEDVLIAQGFATAHQDEKGADAGVDIFASFGPCGFGYPRICVQVKSGTSQVGSAVVRDLMGSVTEHKADLGLLVAWGGFSSAVLKDARIKFFKIRLWSQEELIDALLASYEKLPERSTDKLKLRQMWIPLPLID